MDLQLQMVRPSTVFYHRFSLHMGSSPSFGSSIYDLIALFRLAFTSAPTKTVLTLPYTLTRWSVLQKVRRHPTRRQSSDSLKALSFRVYFTPLTRVLFTFPSRYLFTIDHQYCLALEDGPPRFKPDYTCPTLLRK